MVRDQPTNRPSSRPKATAIRKPARVVHSVTQELRISGTQKRTAAWKISLGAGRMMLDTLKSRQISSQTTKMAMVKSHGARVSTLRFMFAGPQRSCCGACARDP